MLFLCLSLLRLGVLTGTTFELVVARPAAESVVALLAVEFVVAGAAVIA